MHETHRGIVKTKQFLRTRFFWPGMDDATEKMIKNCQACVVNQPLNKYMPLQPMPLSRGPWVKGAVDLVGPVDGKFILTYTDYYLSRLEAYILEEITSHEVIRALTDIFSLDLGFQRNLFQTTENSSSARNLKCFSNRVELGMFVFLRIMREVTESWRDFTDTSRKIFER